MKIKEVRRKGKYLETFSSVDDTWSVWELGGIKYCWSHTTTAFDFEGNEEADVYSEIVEE